MQLAIVAAGFTPGEADQLRRAMAAWKRKGGLGPFEERLIRGMRERGYAEEFARRIFQQILGFGEYGFPESHAASFALLVYVSAWLKRHEPAAFAAALINSQPMGFYAPSQIVQDARRHGVDVRPSTSAERLGLHARARRRRPSRHCGSGCGSSRVLRRRRRSTSSRRARVRPFADAQDLAERARLNRRELGCLAAAGALEALAGHRHRAAWQVAGIEAPLPLLPQPRIGEGIPLLRAPREGRGHRRRLCAHRADAAASSRRAAALAARGALVPERRTAACRCQRLDRAHRGARDHATAARHGERRHVRDTRGRDRLRQPDRLARPGRTSAPRAARFTAAGGHRRTAARRRGDARDRAPAHRPEPMARVAERAGHAISIDGEGAATRAPAQRFGTRAPSPMS